MLLLTQDYKIDWESAQCDKCPIKMEAMSLYYKKGLGLISRKLLCSWSFHIAVHLTILDSEYSDGMSLETIIFSNF